MERVPRITITNTGYNDMLPIGHPSLSQSVSSNKPNNNN